MHYMNEYWEHCWDKTVVERAEAETQLARIALIEMVQLPLPIQEFSEKEPHHGNNTQS